MRELHHVPGVLSSRARIIGLDQDPRTMSCLASLHPGIQVEPLHASIRDVLTGRTMLPPADLIYASGLYDYLDDRIAAALTRSLAWRLRPGGRLLVFNLTPANEEIAFMEAIMDWWMFYRDEEQMAQVDASGAAANSVGTGRTYSIASGGVACLITRSVETEVSAARELAATGDAWADEGWRHP